MGAARHLVARQTVEIVAADRAEAEVFSHRTSRAADRLAEAVERGLDAIEAAGLDLRIDRLELDLGPCDPARWEDALTDGIRGALAARVAEAVERGEAVYRHPAVAARLLLGEFARSGRLPWWATAVDTPASAVATLVGGGSDPEAVRAIVARPGAIERLVNQLDERSLVALVCLARPALNDEAAVAIAALAEAPSNLGGTGAAATDRAAVWRAILTEAAVPGSISSSAGTPVFHRPPEGDEFERFRAAVAYRLGLDPLPNRQAGERRLAQTKRDPIDSSIPPESALLDEAPATVPARLRALAQRHPSAAALFGGLAAFAPHLRARAAQAVEVVLDLSPGASALPALVDIFVEGGAIEASEADGWRRLIAALEANARDEVHDAIAVANSGLVLLWPFLPRFFASLGLLEDDQFRDGAAQHRAAALLHYLAGGEIACPEEELPLDKVLTGIEIDAVHEPGEPLDLREVGAADALLEATLGHAPMLGRIGVAGLREAFLSRPGLLATRDGRWLLRVERRSIDVLLDRLPWTFAWVRLPWMPEPLQVEW